jgi:hypothetical protein
VTGPDVSSAVLAVVSIVILSMAMALRPARARCPDGWGLDTGVRRNGSFECWSPPPAECASSMPGRSSDECHARFPDPVHIDSQIYCTGGTQPIVVDERTVGCQPRGGSW